MNDTLLCQVSKTAFIYLLSYSGLLVMTQLNTRPAQDDQLHLRDFPAHTRSEVQAF